MEFHYTPKHAMWQNIAECVFSLLSRQRLRRRIADQGTLTREVAAWQAARKRAGVAIQWSFRFADARKKLSHLYPQGLLR